MRSPTESLSYMVYGPDPERCLQTNVPDYALLFFDHLYSEYLALKIHTHPDMVVLFESIHEKREQSELTWSDIYTFDLALVDVRPPENLIRKAYDARAKYRSIAGQKEYDEYLASKPPDLTAILIKPSALKLDNEENNPSPPAAVPPSPEPPEEPGIVTGAELEIVQRVLR